MEEPEKRDYGMHLIIDGYGANPMKLDDVLLLYNTLDALPGLIGMNKIGFPYIVRFNEIEIAGITGFILIVESHISVHTYSKKDFISADIYSCKPFNHAFAASFIGKTYEIREMEIKNIRRGTKFPVRNLHA